MGSVKNGANWSAKRVNRFSEGGHDKVRKMGDGLETLNTEEMNGPRLRPMAH